MVLYHVWTNRTISPGERAARIQISAELPFGCDAGGPYWNFSAIEKYDENESRF